ncbi:hypothetical protein [Streptomyces sp. NPDC047525]|uniref:hypothetical protein n=1 Tax=Streptomyces sp. NPDC047525 TaxID=3155264 RepID=UPI003404AB82
MITCLSGLRLHEAELADLIFRHPGGPLAVGPGFEIVLVTEDLAHEAVALLDETSLSVHPIGAVVAVANRWAFFVPDKSSDPAWPAHAEHLTCGGTFSLPPPPGRDRSPDGSRWIRRHLGRRVLTAPLLLQVAVDAASRRTTRMS